MKSIENIKNIRDKVKSKIEEIFDAESLNQLAKDVGFIQRSTSKIKGDDFLKLMTLGFLGNSLESLEGLCDIFHELNPDITITPQALDQRMHKNESVDYLKEIFNQTIKQKIESIDTKISIDSLDVFNKIYFEDSTKIELNEKLADKFPGSGGNASKASLKIDLIYEFKEKCIHEVSIRPGNTPDQSEQEILSNTNKDDLIIRDLGYFCIDSLKEISNKSAYYLSRFKKGVNVYLSNDKDALPIDLTNYINKYYKNQSIIDINVYIGVQKFYVRLIAYKLPEEVVNERRRKAKKNAKKKGREASKEYLMWLSFGFFITNVDESIWDSKMIGTIYRLRWEIELIFKNWKSLLNIEILKGTVKQRIECILYGRLIIITIMTMIYSYISWYAAKYYTKEACFCKIINWLKRKNRLEQAIYDKQLDILFKKIENDSSYMLCKQKRKRKTTQQLIRDNIPYMDSFKNDPSIQLVIVDKAA